MTKNAVLFLSSVKTDNIFSLIGFDEDSITKVLAWTLANSSNFANNFMSNISTDMVISDSMTIQYHRHEKDKGITDLEIYEYEKYHIIIEAKRGWILPGYTQLDKYTKRISFFKNTAPIKKIVTLSECSDDFASVHLPRNKINGIDIIHISWNRIVSQLSNAFKSAAYKEKELLRQARNYFRIIMRTQRTDSNKVYVVSLSKAIPSGWNISMNDVVIKHFNYFHPIGPYWPDTPPTYIAFRYSGQLQSIHHIDHYEIMENLSIVCPGIPDSPVEPHYLYHLGPRIIPPKIVKTGKIYRSGRVWAAIDTLLTCSTISEARDLTKSREEA